MDTPGLLTFKRARELNLARSILLEPRHAATEADVGEWRSRVWLSLPMAPKASDFESQCCGSSMGQNSQPEERAQIRQK